MKPEFNEAFLSDSRDLVDGQIQDFDWDRLYQRLVEDAGETDPRLAEAVTRLLQSIVPYDHRQLHPEAVGLRVIALAWVLSPRYFAGSPSLRDLAKRCGVGAATLARYTGRYSRFIGWRNRGQRHAWNWQEAATELRTDA